MQDGALAIARALRNPSHCLETLDVSDNGFNSGPAEKLCAQVTALHKLSELNLSGNNLGDKVTYCT
jgi:Ran GTPase-activating protein (RanGAP) involved in mRNA processing and transport